MTLRVGTATQIERNPRDLAGTVPAVAYFINTAGVLTLGTGDKAGEATAFLKDAGSDVFTFDDDVAEEDRVPYVVSANEVIV